MMKLIEKEKDASKINVERRKKDMGRVCVERVRKHSKNKGKTQFWYKSLKLTMGQAYADDRFSPDFQKCKIN